MRTSGSGPAAPGRPSSGYVARNLAALSGQRIVFLNWRDPSHPQAGGAEVYAWEMARRFAAAGAELTLLTAAVAGEPADEVVDGVRLLRAGSSLGLYPRTLARLATRFRDADAVVDFQNGIPFFAPLARLDAPVVLVLHHVHQDQFALHMGPAAARLGRFLEGPASRRAYGNRAVVAVSPSTRAAARRRLGFGGPLFVVPNGTPATAPTAAQRSRTPRLVAVGRIVAHKRVDLLVQAVAGLLPHVPDLQVDIVGDGPGRPHLEAMASALGLDGVVHLHGRVDEQQKADLMAAAWLHVQPSAAEGWGLTVMENAAHGVPSLAYDVPGLRDAISRGRTGWLLGADTSLSAGLAAALGELADGDVADRMADDCRRWAGTFTWDDSADRLAGVVLSEQSRRELAAGGRPDRRTSDSTCVVRLSGCSEQDVQRLALVLRRTDVITARPGDSGLDVDLLLYGCDEAIARTVLARAGVDGWTWMGPAGSTDLLAPAPLAARVRP